MSDHDLRHRVIAHPFLAGMSAQHLELLADCAELKQLNANEVIFRAGDPARGFYLIESGSVSVEADAGDRPPVSIDLVKAGEPLGWSWMYEPFVCEYGGRATEPTTALFFDAVRLTQHRGADLTLGHELFKRMSQVMVRRLNAARAKIAGSAAGGRVTS
ncbi:MAG TPA: cyclic nucleotide-binding domain-containing protein [Chthoniobacterales bacterium]|nr:cyclic nucleotide-binding domain-containing protein [Chthoniobacterales bacterium]